MNEAEVKRKRLAALIAACAAALGITPEEALPLKNCAECRHKIENEDGGHCYMFDEEPKSDRCGQFSRVRTYGM